jgi:hypothetical protein
MTDLLNGANLIRPMLGEGMYSPPSSEWFRMLVDTVSSRFPLKGLPELGRVSTASWNWFWPTFRDQF